MILKRLEINQVRNLKNLKFTCASRYNLIYGDNGSGKTSLLEAIYLLVLGRSFRSHLKSPTINHEGDSLSVFGQIYTVDGLSIPAGIQKFTNGQTYIRLNEQTINSVAELVKLLPIQLLNSDSYELLYAGTKIRRQFIDWGVFHVEPRFYLIWAKVERILKQRNAALKQQVSRNEIVSWDDELSVLAQQLHEMRADYVKQLLPVVKQFASLFVDVPNIDIVYLAGWVTDKSLVEQLSQLLSRDLAYGYTCIGPQRATLQLTVGNKPVHAVFSRGQQKILIFILRFAQTELLKRQHSKDSIYLIDDLASELDSSHCQQLIQLIKQVGGQFFITGVDRLGLQRLIDANDSQLLYLHKGVLIPPQ